MEIDKKKQNRFELIEHYGSLLFLMLSSWKCTNLSMKERAQETATGSTPASPNPSRPAPIYPASLPSYLALRWPSLGLSFQVPLPCQKRTFRTVLWIWAPIEWMANRFGRSSSHTSRLLLVPLFQFMRLTGSSLQGVVETRPGKPVAARPLTGLAYQPRVPCVHRRILLAGAKECIWEFPGTEHWPHCTGFPSGLLCLRRLELS